VKPANRKRLRALLWLMALLLLIVFGVRSFVGDVYPVARSSMEPALYPGERVFMRYGREGLKRFDLVVIKDVSGSPIVKRVVAMQNEAVTLTPRGDLLINSAVLPAATARPKPVLVFDDQRQPIEDYFAHGGSSLDPWQAAADGIWILDARDVSSGASAGLLRYRKNLHDDRFSTDGTPYYGDHVVGDAIIECEIQPLAPGGILRFELVEGGETYEARIDITDLELVHLQLRRGSSGPSEVLAEVDLPGLFSTDRWTALRFSNIDNTLTLEVGSGLLQVSCPPNAATTQAPIGERVRLGGEGCQASFRAIRILRDLHYTGRGTYAVERQITLGPDEIFLLGDNSADSKDSREFGPVHLDQILGRPTHVVWPLSAWRTLGAQE
jgi:signal peptidase I